MGGWINPNSMSHPTNSTNRGEKNCCPIVGNSGVFFGDMVQSIVLGASSNDLAEEMTTGSSIDSVSNTRRTNKDAIECVSPSAASFPALPQHMPNGKDFKKMVLFVSVHLLTILVICVSFWVPRGGEGWGSRLAFVACAVVEAFLRVILASWWFRAASPRLALVFVEIDFLTLAMVGLASLGGRYLISMQHITYAPSSLSRDAGYILVGAVIRESINLVSYCIPLGFKQVRCASHLLFSGATAGALNMLYSYIFSGFNPENSELWKTLLMGLTQMLMFTLWTSMGAAIVCHIKQQRLRIWWAPLALIVPVTFHAGYYFAIYGRSCDWLWALISVGYWLLSAIVVKLMLTDVLDPHAKFSSANAFVSDVHSAGQVVTLV